MKFLKKLNISNNRITEIWELPPQLESLSLAGNHIKELNTVIQSLQRLQTLDISNNRISSISLLSPLVNLKCLYANNNEITSLRGIEKLSQLMEIDLSYNLLKTRDNISSLNLNNSIVVISIEANPVLEIFTNSKCGFVFSSLDEFPKEYSEISLGLYFRNPEKLRKLKSSRYRSIIKQYKTQEKYSSQLASPD